MSMTKEAAQKIIASNDGPVIRHHIRDMFNRPIGTVVAIRVGDDVHYGWSLCNMNMDHPVKDVGTAIALQRAKAIDYDGYPYRIHGHMDIIRQKAERYFKGANC
jgi:hypothetical protein